MRRAASVRLLRDAFVERGDDGGLLFFREALGRLFREHASIATQELSFQTEDGHEDAAEDGVGAVEYGEHEVTNEREHSTMIPRDPIEDVVRC